MKKWIFICMFLLISQKLWATDIEGTVQWSQRVELSTPISGIVQYVYVQVGDKVKRRQVLLSLDGTALRAKVAESESEITHFNAQVEEDKRDLKRIQELFDRTIVSTTELDQAKLRLVKSQSALAEAQARLKQNQKAFFDTSIRAPFDAVVILRNAEPGQSVAAGLQPQMLLTLARNGQMIARMYLSSTQIDKLKPDMEVTVAVSGTNYKGNIKTMGLEPEKIKEEWLYPVDVLFAVKGPLRAGTPAILKLP